MSFNDRRILVADDSTAALLLVEGYAKGLGCSVVKVEHGRAAMEAMKIEVFDLVILDIRMPEMSGFEVMVAMKELPAYRDTPVIIMSASTDTKDRVEGLRLGAHDFMSKPFGREELQARLKTSLKLVEYREQLESTKEFYGDFVATLASAHKPGLNAGELLALLDDLAMRHGLGRGLGNG